MELLIYIGKAAAILSIFYLVYIAVLRKDTLFSANRHYLLSGILAAIAFPFIEITKTIQVEIPASNEIVYNEFLLIEQMPIQEAVSINWWQVAFIIYALGACIMLLRFMKQLLSLGLVLYKYPSVKKDGYHYIITSENTPPFSFFRNIVYNPELHTPQELEMILTHEEVHASQWHSIDIIATNLLLIVQWINPLAWLYKKRVEENLEYIADGATAQQIESVKQYQLALVKASSTSPIPALTNNFYQSFIKKRIVMLNKRTSKKINAWKLMLVLPLLAVFLWSFNINEVVTYTESNEPDSEFTNPSSASEGIVVPSENKLLNDSEEISGNITREVIPEYEANPIMDEAIAMAQENNRVTISERVVKSATITITKNTTKKELDAMKTDLKSNGVSFDYSNLEYNKSNEIIGISINYKNKNGNSGNYSVNSDTPINTIVIKTDRGNQISVRSVDSNSYSHSNGEDEVHVRTEEQHVRTEEQHVRTEEQHVRTEEQRFVMEGRRKEMEHRREEMKERQVEMEVQRAQLKDEIEERQAEMRERQNNALFSGDLKRITKNSSKNDLEELRRAFDSKGISFSYNGVKRNDAGEITKIKLKIKDNKGSSSSSSFNGEGQTIDNILIDINNGITIMNGSSH
jgi:bla regulator protein BlaR1